MKLIEHHSMDAFLQGTLAHLEQNEALNNLMLGICNRVKTTPEYYKEVYMVTVEESKDLILAAVMTEPQKLVVYCNKEDCDDAIELLIQDLRSKNRSIPGVVGSKELSQKACDIWRKYHQCNIKLEMNMRVYELREVNKDMIRNGIFRVAGEEDLELVAQWVGDFEMDTGLNMKPDREKSYEMAKNRIQEKSIFLWEDEGKVVSMAAKARPTQNGCTVNLVYTPKELRGRGYASSCVAALSQHLLDSGYKFCSLFTDLANPTSNSIYMKIGYKPVGDFDGYIIERN